MCLKGINNVHSVGHPLVETFGLDGRRNYSPLNGRKGEEMSGGGAEEGSLLYVV